MTTTTWRALRDSLLAGLLACAAVSALAAAAYTPEERKLVDKLPQLFQAKCLEGATLASEKDSPERRAANAPFLEAMKGPDGACACVSAELMRHVTPEFLHRPDVGKQMTEYTTQAGTVCMGRMIRTAFPAICPEMMRKAIATHGTDIDTATYVPGLCQCVQKRMDALSNADLRPYMQALMAQSNSNRDPKDVALETLPASFATDIRECGVAAANKMIDAETSKAKAVTAEAAASEAAPASAP